MMSLITLCVLFMSFGVYQGFRIEDSISCPAEQREPWSYRGRNGPRFWGVIGYPTCYGDQQSPVDIITTDAVKDENLDKLTLNNYDQPITQGTIENNGHTIEVIPGDGISRTISVNGQEYSLQQFHFHWGSVYYKGSEHTIDGTQYAMEMHLVHMNANNQIAVVGIFLQEQDKDNEELQNLVNELSNVKYKDQETPVQSSINLNNLLPANPTSYYRYQGSLTTPACSEGVIWSVVPSPIPVGRNQMKQFRDLYAVKKGDAWKTCKLVNNYRPLQPLNDRKVYLSQ